jgi:hypothetical protein
MAHNFSLEKNKPTERWEAAIDEDYVVVGTRIDFYCAVRFPSADGK